MGDLSPDPKAIFFEALEQPGRAELMTYLDAACGGNKEIRSRVEDLLRAHHNAGKFLGGSASAGETTDAPASEEPERSLIGPYKLLQTLGEGGMGIVYMAEQQEPVRRRVALKVIKPGMVSPQVIARFEAERQVLAMLDHPNIAKVLEASMTESGRPYFVMELVKGVPITEYCDDHCLSARRQLKASLHANYWLPDSRWAHAFFTQLSSDEAATRPLIRQ